MARRVLVTRPEPEALSLVEALERRGFEPVVAPMLTVVPTGATVADTARYQAAVVTSRNGADGLAAATSRRAMPVFAVGEATAERLHRHGFSLVTAAEGTGAALVDLLLQEMPADGGPILWASGDEVRVDLAAELEKRGFGIDRVVVYRAEAATALPPAAAEALAARSLDGVLFFSPRTAERFASLVTDAGLAQCTATMSAYCLSAAVAEAARALPWAAVRTAARPTREDLLATLGDADPD